MSVLDEWIPKQPIWNEEVSHYRHIPVDRRERYLWTNFEEFRDKSSIYSHLPPPEMHGELVKMGYLVIPLPIKGRAYLEKWAYEAVSIEKLKEAGLELS